MSSKEDSGPHIRYELELEETRDSANERQQALEILGKAIDKLIPGHRASGTVVEHATATAKALLDTFGLGVVVMPPNFCPLDPTVDEDLVEMARIMAAWGRDHDPQTRDITESWRHAFQAHGRRAVGVALAQLVRSYQARADRALALTMAEGCDFTQHARLSGERQAFTDAITILLAHSAKIEAP